MTKDLEILVLLGGDSSEREISLRSGKSVSVALGLAGFNVKTYDTINGFAKLEELINANTVVLPILHGSNGEDGVLQACLEKLGAKYLGTKSKQSEICFSKSKTHKVLEKAGVKMAKNDVISLKTYENHPLTKKPFVIKPINGGSSVDTTIVRNLSAVPVSEIKILLKKYSEMIIEELIEGQEITVPVLGKEALPVIAIIPPSGGEFDYLNKYNGSTKEICPVDQAIVSADIQLKAQVLALKVHDFLGARHLSRTDMIIDEQGELFVLELNTIPGLTDQSLFPKSASVAGYNMKQLVTKLVNLVFEE